MATPTPAKKSRARKSEPTAVLLKNAADLLTKYDANADYKKKEKDVKLDTLITKLTDQTSILQLMFQALALPDLNEQGHEVRPVTDFAGKARATASSAHMAYRMEIREYLSGKMKETEFSDFSGDLTEIRRHIRDAFEQTKRMLKAIETSKTALEQQRELYGQLHGDEIDEEIRHQEELIQKKTEAIATLKAKKNAKGRKAANG